MLLLALAIALANPPAQPSSCVLPDGFVVNLELALTDEERATGLMFRESLEPNWGMLFVFGLDGFWPFWMKNTTIPLDMVWLDREGVVVEVQASIQPCRLDPCPSYSPGVVARAVLELGAGIAARHGVTVGSRLRIHGVPDYPLPAPTPPPDRNR